MANQLAVKTAQRLERLLPSTPIPIDTGLCRHAVDLLRTLPGEAGARGLAHGDFNPGNILRNVDAGDSEGEWLAIDPSPVHGDLAWDPWPLLTQIHGPTGEDWTVVLPDPAEFAHRVLVVADVAGLDAARTAAWCVARGVEHGLWPPTAAGGQASSARMAIWPGQQPGRRQRLCSVAD